MLMMMMMMMMLMMMMGGDACDLVSTVNRVRATDAENHPRVKLQNGDFRDDEVVHDDDEDEVNKNRKYVPFTPD